MAKIKEVEGSLGISIEINGTWVRLNAREMVEMDKDDNIQVRNATFDQIWKELGQQLTKQIETLKKG